MTSPVEHAHENSPAAVPGVPVEMILSEERLAVGTTTGVSGYAVLRKTVVTEEVTQTFQVRHEEVHLEQRPAPASDRPVGDGGTASGAFDDDVYEMVLYREVPVVTMQLVPVERVRLRKSTVTERVTVAEDLRSEHVTLDTSGVSGSAGLASGSPRDQTPQDKDRR